MTKHTAPARRFPGDYRIIDEVASSATSRIFLGETISSPQQFVAIKRLYTTHLDSQQEEDFRQETSFLQQLNHPHILPFITAESDKGVPYIVTDYAPNSSLDKSMQHQTHLPWPQERALVVISQIGQALHYAHQQNIIHCNLKPQNILFDAEGQTLLTDFYLSSLPESLRASAPTTYTAPEQLLGEMSKACDQYALGCIAYEMLTGHTPYHASSLYYPGIRRRLPTLVAPTLLNPLLAPHVEQAVLKALAPEPTQRHGDIQAFLKALGNTTDEAALGKQAATFSSEAQSRATIYNRSTPQPLASSATSAQPLERVNYQRNSSSRAKTYIFKQKKMMIALSCILLSASIISALYWLVSTQAKPPIQPTPTKIKLNQSIVTTTHSIFVTPSIALSATPTGINQQIIVQPLPTTAVTAEPAIVPPSPTSIPILPAMITPTMDTEASAPALATGP